MGCCGKPDSFYRLHIDFIELPSDKVIHNRSKGFKEDVLFHNCSSENQVALLTTKESGAVTSVIVEPSTSKISELRCPHYIQASGSAIPSRILKYTKLYE